MERCQAVLDDFVISALRDQQWPSEKMYEAWETTQDRPSRTTMRIRLDGFGAVITERAIPLLLDHFADALRRLDAGEMVDPATYIGPLTSV